MNDWTIKLRLANGQRHTAHYFNMTIVEALRIAQDDWGHAKSAKVSQWDGSFGDMTVGTPEWETDK